MSLQAEAEGAYFPIDNLPFTLRFALMAAGLAKELAFSVVSGGESLQ